MVDFRKILGTKVEDVKRPPLIPVGTYRARVAKPVSYDEISNGRFKVMDFQLQLVEPMADVDADALTEYGGLGKGSVLTHRFMFSTEEGPEAAANVERTVFNLKRFRRRHDALVAQIKGLGNGGLGAHRDNGFLKMNEALAFGRFHAQRL